MKDNRLKNDIIASYTYNMFMCIYTVLCRR